MALGWHVLGVGAIGGLFACRLQEGGAHVTLLTRDQLADSRALTLIANGKKIHTFPQQSVAGHSGDTREPSTAQPVGPPISHLLVCTKAWAVAEAIASVADRLSDQSIVVLLCNGMGLTKDIASLIQPSSLVLGTTTSGCRRASDSELILSGEGTTVLGLAGDPTGLPNWHLPWQRGVPNISWASDIESVLLAKAALNAVINPLTALHRVANGALLTPPLRDTTDKVIREIQMLLCAAGASAVAEALPSRVTEVCTVTATNHSSMRVDLESGRRTEIDAIVGWLLTELLPNPPATPLLSELYRSIRHAERSLLYS
ncbi:MAG: 2-dehydropantoate 2-reductase [Luminiphilus sp.]|jgi:2-dehydropantoate 2-reductase|nr:2-dehydropantoate 2-reductase [Luminiphilus sp.]